MRNFARKPALMAATAAITASLATGVVIDASATADPVQSQAATTSTTTRATTTATTTTPAAGTPVAPTAATNGATAVSTTSESLLGTVNPNGSATGYHFDYGTTTAYGSTTPSEPAGNGTTAESVAQSINGLTPGTTYHYRIVAQSPTGTVPGSDQTFVAGGTSAVKVLGREGFVSPGNVIGIQIGCFGGVTTCSGTFTVTAGSTLVGQHGYSIAPNNGGFNNFKLTPAGANMLASNSVNHLLGVKVTVHDHSGQTLTFIVHLARWFWHS